MTAFPGWNSGDLLMESAFYQHEVHRVGPRGRFVEIGSWKGSSAVCMASAIRRSGKRIEFHDQYEQLLAK
jgi:predicted O-methyltransferase YrrM